MPFWLALAVLFAAAYLLFSVYLIYEFITAPVLDENLRVVSDPHHRMPHATASEG